ncbi:hypothetical protein MTP99_015313 [Tenebrio molitor]|nr:hypothetical protein MTP99_015313 [Tenebrio molitor]
MYCVLPSFHHVLRIPETPEPAGALNMRYFRKALSSSGAPCSRTVRTASSCNSGAQSRCESIKQPSHFLLSATLFLWSLYIYPHCPLSCLQNDCDGGA